MAAAVKCRLVRVLHFKWKINWKQNPKSSFQLLGDIQSCIPARIVLAALLLTGTKTDVQVSWKYHYEAL